MTTNNNLSENSPRLELKAPLWVNIILPLALLVGTIVIIVIFLQWLTSPHRDEFLYSFITLGFLMLLCTWGFFGFRKRYREASSYLSVDQWGITMRYSSNYIIVPWERITYCEFVDVNEKGDLGEWFTLRDAENIVLLQFNKDWQRYDARSIKKFDNLVELVRNQINERMNS